MDYDIKSLKSGILMFLRQNNRSGFTEKQIIRAFLGDPEKVPESDSSAIRSMIESLVEEKSVTKSVLSTKSGQKTYYRSM